MSFDRVQPIDNKIDRDKDGNKFILIYLWTNMITCFLFINKLKY